MAGQIGVRALKQNASAVVARASAGEVLEITDRNRPVAQLGPLPSSPLDGLVASGLARPARRSVADLPPAIHRRRGAASLSDLLAASRDDER